MLIRRRSLLLLCASGAWLQACTSLPAASHDVAGGAVACAVVEPTRHVVTDSVTLWLFAPREVREGEPVPMRVELENTRAGLIEIELGGQAPHADFVITDATGLEVWSAYHGLVPLSNGDPRRLDTSERLVFPLTWNQGSGGTGARSRTPVPPGDYLLRARVRLGPTDVETPARSLRITRR